MNVFFYNRQWIKLSALMFWNIRATWQMRKLQVDCILWRCAFLHSSFRAVVVPPQIWALLHPPCLQGPAAMQLFPTPKTENFRNVSFNMCWRNSEQYDCSTEWTIRKWFPVLCAGMVEMFVRRRIIYQLMVNSEIFFFARWIFLLYC
jgi:hypothetical protein